MFFCRLSIYITHIYKKKLLLFNRIIIHLIKTTIIHIRLKGGNKPNSNYDWRKVVVHNHEYSMITIIWRKYKINTKIYRG